MERRRFLGRLGTGTIAVSALVPLGAASSEASAGKTETNSLKNGAIQHMVIFNLNHEKGSAQAEKFLGDGKRILTRIPVVQNFQVFNQTSLKNGFDYGFSMVFEDKLAYDTYNNHPDHVGFVENRWKKEVDSFLEIDFQNH